MLVRIFLVEGKKKNSRPPQIPLWPLCSCQPYLIIYYCKSAIVCLPYNRPLYVYRPMNKLIINYLQPCSPPKYCQQNPYVRQCRTYCVVILTIVDASSTLAQALLTVLENLLRAQLLLQILSCCQRISLVVISISLLLFKQLYL